MPLFRLLNLETLATEEFDLDNHPLYLAASHAWIDNSFGVREDGFYDSFGGKGIKAVVHEAFHEVRYCWVDRFCINQKDKNDKLIQIPLMERIFKQAQAVVVFLKTHIGVDQADVDRIVAGLEGIVEMCQEEEYEKLGPYWQNEEGRDHIIDAMNGLRRLVSTTWATRVWTMQEFVLASTIFWIGLDLQPIRIADAILFAVPDACDNLAIEECLTPQMQAVFSYLHGMANVRRGSMDRTRVMELLEGRKTKKPVDEVYGAMSATGVIIPPVAAESKFTAWRRWCEAALTQGNARWMLLPRNGRTPEDGEKVNCIMPIFADRSKLSASSGLDLVEGLGPVAVSNGCVTASARKLGSIKIIRRLGSVHEDRNGRINRDITLILFAEGRKQLALQLVSAFGGGRYNSEQADAIATVLVKNYITTVPFVLNNTEEDFRPSVRGDFQRFVWNDFMHLQTSQMIGLNEGVGYMCQISHQPTSERLLTVLVSGDYVPSTELEVLDFGARDPSSRCVLMAVTSHKQSRGSLHKVGMTLPVSDDFSASWAKLPLERVSIGGEDCYHCGTPQAGPSSRHSNKLVPSNSSVAMRKARLDATKALRKQLGILTWRRRKRKHMLRLHFGRTFTRVVSKKKSRVGYLGKVI
ncbi:hypothetical protein H2200_011778 [Cladophialophora chaetospira]|uniref:Heterokaryon incompatibility domain-containing protein n=1 Tax=Cladophialophora chaetospira TaxID=386627 RepID=A0AA39CCW5_9EURO|nr:hypothetical protein H2200_011778 [Cladophialophora chaetospira]